MDDRIKAGKEKDKEKELQMKLRQMEKIKESILQNSSSKNDERIQFLLRRL